MLWPERLGTLSEHVGVLLVTLEDLLHDRMNADHTVPVESIADMVLVTPSPSESVWNLSTGISRLMESPASRSAGYREDRKALQARHTLHPRRKAGHLTDQSLDRVCAIQQSPHGYHPDPQA